MEKKGQMKNGKTLWFLLNLIVGLYFLNLGLNFVPLTFIGDPVKNVIIIVGGALIVVNGLMSLTRRTPYAPGYR